MSCSIHGHAGAASPRQDNPMADLLLESVAALAACGEVDRACRLAGRAYSASRKNDPSTARRFDVLLHRLTRLVDD
jgi:hypothetical protein